MIPLEIFSFDDYRSFIKAKVKSEKNNWGLWARLAKAASCQATYLTQAMKGKAHLTADHLMGIAKFWEFSESETDFILLLLEHAKAGTKSLKEHFQTKIKRIRHERENIAKRFDKPRLEIGIKENLYYSAWYWSALHVIVSIPEYNSAPTIARRLNLSADFVEHALNQLAQYGIVQRDGKNWKLGLGDIHIPKESLLTGINHNNWRQRAVTDSTLFDTDSVHFTAIYSLSHIDYRHLKEKMLDLIEHTRKVVTPSKEEELVCFACDFFKV